VKVEAKKLAAIRESLKSKTQAFSAEITKKQNLLEPWNEKINQKQLEIAVAQSKLDILRDRAAAGGVALEEAHNKVAAIEVSRDEKVKELKTLQTEK
jgi:structural maintenance of chromosome 4